MFIYTKYNATFSVYGGRIWLLVITIAVFAGGSLVLSWKLERNWLSLLSGTILPVLVFEVISMWKYSLVIRIVSIIIGIIAITLGIIWASKKVSQIKRVNAIIPAALEQGGFERGLHMGKLFSETGIPTRMRNHPVTKLCEKLFDEHRRLDFHRYVLGVRYRKRLMDELANA